MRRRRLLAAGAAVVGFAGCSGNDAEDRVLTRPATEAGPSDRTDRTGRSRTSEARQRGPTPTIGGSLNGRPFRLKDDLGLLEKSGTTWLHAFLDVRKKYEHDVNPQDDPDVAALRRAGDERGVKLFVSLMWDFIGLFGDKGAKNLPSAGSYRERALFDYASELLAAIEGPVDIVGLGNEPIWETLDEDFLGDDPPLLRFTRDLKDHLVAHYPGDESRYFVGALNRLYTDHVRKKYGAFYEQLLDMARNDDDIDGVDLHVHYETLEQAEEMLEVARRTFPDGLVTATEFSPMWRYDKHKNEAIAAFEGGERFAERYGLEGDTTIAEYFEAAKDDRLSRREMADFMETMPWYNVNFVEDMYGLLDSYDVSIGTFGFIVEDDVDQLDWTEEWAPFPLNCLFQPALIDTGVGAHPHYLDDFRRRAESPSSPATTWINE